jgi:hypothetical protein
MKFMKAQVSRFEPNQRIYSEHVCSIYFSAARLKYLQVETIPKLEYTTPQFKSSSPQVKVVWFNWYQNYERHL